VVLNPGWSFRLITALTLATGTTFLMWLGEQITERGIGNGISLIIFAGIVAGIPQAFSNTFRLIRIGEMSIFFGILIAILALAVVAFVIFMDGLSSCCFRNIYGDLLQTNPNTICKKDRWEKNLRRAECFFALEVKHFRRYTTHIRIFFIVCFL